MSKGLSLGKKLIFGFSGVLVLLLSISILSFSTIENASNQFVTYRNLARYSALLNTFQANMLMVRVNIVNFLHTGSEKSYENYQTYLSTTDKNLQKSLENLNDTRQHQLLKSAESLLEQYRDKVDNIKDEINKQNELVSKMVKSGLILENTLTEMLNEAQKNKSTGEAYYASLSLKNLFLSRLYTSKLLSDKNTDHIPKIKSEFLKLEKSLKALQGHSTTIREATMIKSLFNAKIEYRDNFDSLVNVLEHRSLYQKTLEKLGPQIADIVKQTTVSLEEEQASLGSWVQSSNDRATLIIMIISIISVLAGAVIAWLIIRGVMAQLGKDPQEIAFVAKKLGEGDLNISFDDNSHGVYGEMRKTVEKLIDVVSQVLNASQYVSSGSEQLSSTAQALRGPLSRQLLLKKPALLWKRWDQIFSKMLTTPNKQMPLQQKLRQMPGIVEKQ